MITAKYYQALAMRTNDGLANKRLINRLYGVSVGEDEPLENYKSYGTILNACLGLSGEVGELNDMIKKHIFHEHALDETHLIHELGDILWYITLMAEAYGVDLERVMRENIDKLKLRYPNGFDVNASQHRAQGVYKEYENND